MNLQHIQFFLLTVIQIFNEIYCQAINTMNSTILNRQRRSLVFPTGARNAIRINFKHNRVVPITAILAYSDGMRLQWDLPTQASDIVPRYRREEQRRDVFEFVEQILATYGLDGEACVMRALCETARQTTPTTGIIKKILHLIFIQPEHDDKYVQRDHQSCQDFMRRCSFSLLGPSYISPMHELHPRD